MTINPLSTQLLTNHPQDAARVLEKYPAAELAGFLNNVPDQTTARIFRYLIPSVAVDCLGEMPSERAAVILAEFSVERVTALLRRMPIEKRNTVIRDLSPVLANMVKLVLRFPEGTVGQLMTPRVFAAHEDMRSEDILQMVQGMTGQLQKIIFIINDNHHLVGRVDIRDLLTMEPVSAIGKIMQPPGNTLSARASIKSAQQLDDWKYIDVMPVLDHAGVFVGVLKRGVMLDALARDSATEQEDFTGAALAIAELFWETCTNVLTREPDKRDKRQKDD